VLSDSPAGGHIHRRKQRRTGRFFVTGHSEYDRDTLANEYFRDVGKGPRHPRPLQIISPMTTRKRNLAMTWRAHATPALFQLAQLFRLSEYAVRSVFSRINFPEAAEYMVF
jgi:homoserine O-succinyltransferase